MTSLPLPGDLGLPSQFTFWRPNQDDAINMITNMPHRTIVPVAPTGTGKTLMYVASAIILGGRAVILTSTKALQTQLMNDFRDIGMVDIRGRNAYRCKAVHDGTKCDYGPCIAGWECNLRHGGCSYFDQLKRARNSNLVVTNYAYWYNANQYSYGIGKFDIIICDEAHDAPNVVTNFMSITFKKSDPFVERILPETEPNDISGWRTWAIGEMDGVSDAIEAVKYQVKHKGSDRDTRRHLAKLLNLERKLKRMEEIDDTWVCGVDKWSIAFAPIQPGMYCEENLFLNIDKVILTSASVNSKTIELLGVDDDNSFINEYPHTFPIENRRLIHVPTVRMNFRTGGDGLRFWLSRIDQIIKLRLDRKGILHTVSYARRDFVRINSKHNEYMISHNRAGIAKVVAKFKKSDPPLVLVSPSVTTGFDFPKSECEYQIIGKVPYPDTRDKLTKARCEKDNEYAPYIAMQELVQAVGRGVRAADDRCETFIIDDNISWFMDRYRHFAPEWFSGAYMWSNNIPRPMEKL